MCLVKRLISAILLSLMSSVTHAESGCPGVAASSALRPIRDGLLVVSAAINHTGPYDLLVDTGSQITVIDPAVASFLHLRIEGSVGVSGVRTQSQSSFVFLDLIEVGSHSVQESLAVIQKMSELKVADPHIRGILGQNFLSRFDMLIDNRKRILCLDESPSLSQEIEGEHIALEQPHGPRDGLSFIRPLVISVRLAAANLAPVMLRLDSGSNAALLYADQPSFLASSINQAPVLKRVVNGEEQAFAVLPTQDIFVGKHLVRQVPFEVPLNGVDRGPHAREDGLLPTSVFERIFISYSKNYAVFNPRINR